jgi:hypothetical protein
VILGQTPKAKAPVSSSFAGHAEGSFQISIPVGHGASLREGGRFFKAN